MLTIMPNSKTTFGLKPSKITTANKQFLINCLICLSWLVPLDKSEGVNLTSIYGQKARRRHSISSWTWGSRLEYETKQYARFSGFLLVFLAFIDAILSSQSYTTLVFYQVGNFRNLARRLGTSLTQLFDL